MISTLRPKGVENVNIWHAYLELGSSSCQYRMWFVGYIVRTNTAARLKVIFVAKTLPAIEVKREDTHPLAVVGLIPYAFVP